MEDHRPPLKEPTQRYLRRRANRRVRKERWAKSLGRWGGLVAINLALLTVASVIGARTLNKVSQSDHFQIRTLKIEGVALGSADALRERLEGLHAFNLFDIELHRIAELVEEDPWVAQCSIKRVLPDTLRITVQERQPVAVALLKGKPHLVDPTGMLIDDLRGRYAGDLPVLTGISEEQLDEDLDRGVRALLRLQRRAPEFAESLSEVDLSSSDRITARLLLPGPDFLLDPEFVERNVTNYVSLQEEIGRRLGALRAVDLRWDGRISFMQAEKK